MQKVAIFEIVPYKQFKEDMLKLFITENKMNDNEYIKQIELFIEDSYKNIRLPERATVGSAGYDFYAPFSFKPSKGSGVEIPTGIRVRMESDWVLMMFPRSGQGFKYGMREYNTVGIIDSDYYYSDNYGHIKMKMTVEEQCPTIEARERFCQGIFVPFGITTDDTATAIRNGGHGSTGK